MKKDALMLNKWNSNPGTGNIMNSIAGGNLGGDIKFDAQDSKSLEQFIRITDMYESVLSKFLKDKSK